MTQPTRMCIFPECGGTKIVAFGYCGGHYQQHWSGRPLRPLAWTKPHIPAPCGFDGCPNSAFSVGLCKGHAAQKHLGKELVALRVQRPRRTKREVNKRDDLGRKHCVDCDTWLPIVNFPPSQDLSDGLSYRCNGCIRAYILRTRYKMTPEDFRSMLAGQGGCCAICRRQIGYFGDTSNVDHDHECCPGQVTCGKCVRGILCPDCNVGIGKFHDDTEKLRAAIGYLQTSLNPKKENHK